MTSENTPRILFGSQYYRAPTPLPEDWERDLDRFAACGFNTIKYWAQWRWNNPGPGEYWFDDLDRLMDMAADRDLKVIINTLFDCAPVWIFDLPDDCRMVCADGRKLGPRVTGCRQIGGFPGPCLNHPEARRHRMDFIDATVRRYAAHPAMYIWDTWNEPNENAGQFVVPSPEQQICYCRHCERLFKEWLLERFGSLASVNARWQRNYRSMEELELPVSPSTFTDIIDWRQFHIDTVSREQEERVRAVRAADPDHIVMCHTVPMPTWNPVGAASDDWALSAPGDWVGNSLGSDPFAADLICSAGAGKTAINSEIHALPGSSLSRPHPLGLSGCKHHIFTPLAHGIKGFVFWQFRPESLGLESPAWGLTRPDGSPSPWLPHFEAINATLQADPAFYWNAMPEGPEVGILYNPANHVFCWCAQGSFDLFDRAVHGTYNTLADAGFRVRFVHPSDFATNRLNDLRVLVCPFAYVFDDALAEALREWVRAGGCLIGEAFFANLRLDSSLHPPVVPGMGFDEVFGAREGVGTPFSAATDYYSGEQGVTALSEGPGMVCPTGWGELPSGHRAMGFLTRTPLETAGADPVAFFSDDSPAVTVHPYGKGSAILFGTLVSVASGFDVGAKALLTAAVAHGQPEPRPRAEGPVRVNVLRHGQEWGVVLTNRSDQPVEVSVRVPGAPASAVLEEVMSLDRISPEGAATWRVALDPNAVELYRMRT
jgi:beta-galactosidase